MKAEKTTREVPGQGVREVMQVSFLPSASAHFHAQPISVQMDQLARAGLDPGHTLGLFMTNDTEGVVYYFTVV